MAGSVLVWLKEIRRAAARVGAQQCVSGVEGELSDSVSVDTTSSSSILRAQEPRNLETHQGIDL